MADSLGFAIFYISNRKEEAVLDGTIKNLRNAGFPQATCENVLLRQKKGSQNPDPSDKQARRDIVRNKGFEIVLMAGDNLGDFYTDRLKEDARHKMLDSIRGKLGKEYIIVPNAMYGNWPAAAGIDSNSMIEKLDSMSSIFNYR